MQVVAPDGQVYGPPSASQRRLLAVLAVHAPRALRAEFLSELLAVSPGALRTTVSRLRRILGDDALHTDAHGYRLDASVDSARFVELVTKPPAGSARLDQLDEALAGWHGEALDEFRHESWAVAEVTRLDELRALALETKAALLIAQDRPGEAVVALEPHVSAFPLRDQPRGLLMRALAAQGRQAEALRAYDSYWRYLAEEVGTEPSAEVQAIERRIASGPGDAAPAPAALERSAFPIPRALNPPDAFVGRDGYVEWLDAQFVEVAGGSCRALLLAGEPGVGKSALVAAWAHRARLERSAIVVCGRDIEGDPVPLQPFREIVGYLVDQLPDEVLARHVTRFGGELIRLAPQLQRRLPDAPPPTRTDSATERRLLFDAVADAIREVATLGPTVVVLEDLHWAEPTTLRLVRQLIPQLGGAPVMLVATYRDGESDQTPELRATLADLARNAATRVRRVEGLSARELSALATTLVGAPPDWDAGEFVAHLDLATAGNPLFASQLVRHLAESGRLTVGTEGIQYERGDVPQDLRDIVWRRVSLLGDHAIEILATGSALGVEFDVEVLGAMVDVSGDEFTTVINGATGARLLNEGSTPRTLRFTHAVVAQSLYGELRGVDRSRVHERAARVLTNSAGQHPQRIMVQLARHWELAGNDSEALTWSVAAGDGATNQLAPAEAARWYAVAVDHAQKLGVDDATLADLTIKLGDSQRRAGQPATRDTLLQAAELARRAGAADPLIRAALLNTRGFQSGLAADAERLEVIEAALAVVGTDNESERAQLLALLGQELNNTPDVARRRNAANDAIAIARASSDPALLARIAPAALYALWEPGSTSARSQLANDAIDRAELCGDPLLEFRIHTAAYTAAIEAADSETASRSLRKLQQLARRLGEPGPRWVVGLYEVFEATVAGDLGVAEALNNANLELGLELGEDDAFNMFAGQFYQCRSFAWRLEELFPIVEQAATESLDLPFRTAFAILCTRFGRIDEAQRFLDEGSRCNFANVPRDALWSTAIVGYAILANELNDATIAPQIIEMLEPIGALNAFSGVTSQGCIAAAVGRLLSVVGDYAAAEEQLLAALDVHTAFGWHYFRATGLAALAQNRRRWKGELDSFARECVAEAEAIARPRGLGGALEQIRWATSPAPVSP